MKLIALFAILTTTYGVLSLNPKIVGGQNAVSGQLKYMASLRYADSGGHSCGSTIISSRTLVTAAHCFLPYSTNWEVMVGSTQQNDTESQKRRVSAVIIHPEFDPQLNTNDVALLILDAELELNERVQPASLPDAPTNVAQLTASGWGYTSYPSGEISNDLQWFQTKSLPTAYCEIYFPVMTGRLCALARKGQGVCLEDSGGPLVNNNNELVGIISDLFECAIGLPDLFTDVFYFKEWILQNAQM